MTPLRQRFLDDLRMRNLSPRTQDAYVRAVAQFAKHFKRSPDQLGREHIREYLLHLIRLGRAWETHNQVRCGLHFFYRVTLGQGLAPRTAPLRGSPNGSRSSSAGTRSGRSSLRPVGSRGGPC